MLVVTVTKQNEDFMVWRITNNGLISLQYPITITDSQYYLHHSPPTPLRYKPQGRSLSFAICCPLLSATTRFSYVFRLIYLLYNTNKCKYEKYFCNCVASIGNNFAILPLSIAATRE